METPSRVTIGELRPGASAVLAAETGDRPAGPVQYELKLSRSALRRRSGSGVSSSEVSASQRPSDVVHVRAYSAPNWFTTEGVSRKRRLIESKGLPEFTKWRFITLTLNREAFGEDPLAGYLAGKRRMGKFLSACRESGLWADSARWCWKLEFQQDGWAHWHLLVERKVPFTVEQMAELARLWKLGRTNVEMVRQDDFLYSFKYAFKPVRAIEEEHDLFEPEAISWAAPAWFLDYFKVPEDSSKKPQSFARVRFWQTSAGFYTKDQPQPSPAAGNPTSSIVPQPAREIAVRRASTVQVVARKKTGRYLASGVLLLSCLTGQFWDRVGFDAFHGGAVGLAVNSFVAPAYTIERHTKDTWKLQQLLRQNRLTLNRAAILQRAGETLRTC